MYSYLFRYCVTDARLAVFGLLIIDGDIFIHIRCQLSSVCIIMSISNVSVLFACILECMHT